MTPLQPDTHCFDDDTGKDVWSYSCEIVEKMQTEIDALQGEKLELQNRLAIEVQLIDMRAEAAAKLTAEIDRLRSELCHQAARDGHIGTHSAQCYSFGRRHYECALREIGRLKGSGPERTV